MQLLESMMDVPEIQAALEKRHAAEAYRDRWVVRIVVVTSMVGGAALFGAGILVGNHMQTRCIPTASKPQN